MIGGWLEMNGRKGTYEFACAGGRFEKHFETLCLGDGFVDVLL